MSTPVDVVGRASAVLRALSTQEPTGATTANVARHTGLARPTTHRLLISLQGEGLVDRDAAGRWLLGPMLHQLGATAAPRYDVSRLARPFVRRLARATGDGAFYSARRGDETVCLLGEEGSFPIRSHLLDVGSRFPLGVSEAGIAVLAHLDDIEIERFLERTDLATANGESHASALVRQRVTSTRRMGYSLNPGLILEGSWGIGAAVLDAGARPVGALSLTGIERRFSANRSRDLGSLLLRAAFDLGHSMRGAKARTPPREG